MTPDRHEMTTLARTWWCRGGGAAVLALLAVVVIFRAPRDGIFWAAIAFFVAHTGMTAWRYVRDRKHRATVAVTQVHVSSGNTVYPPVIFTPLASTSIIVDLSMKPPTSKAS